ncbi:MAG TPA: AraC family transcriptional regulator [Lachnospiraceae bacterium]|nr:AraC family transcriptional regulator [Lachnospiraceae bacterium]
MIELKYIGCHYKEDTTFLIDRPEGSKDYLLLLFHSDIYVILNDQLEHLSPGSLILYSPNYPQYYYNSYSGIDNDWFHFNAKDFESFLSSIQIPCNTPIYINNITFFHQFFLSIEKEHLMKDIGASMMMNYMIKSLFIHLSRDYNSTDTPIEKTPHYEYERLFREVRSRVLSQMDYSWTIHEMSSLVGLSRSRFSYLYKNIIGLSPKEDLMTARINMAKHLLQSNNQPISSIAEKVGYTNIYQFSKQFKNFTTLSPTAYRNKKRTPML